MARLDFEGLRDTYPLANVLARLGVRLPAADRALVSCLLPGHDDERPSMSLVSTRRMRTIRGTASRAAGMATR
jgi:hypothetical protein